MKAKYLSKPTTYCVKFWNADGSEMVKQDIYPMHIFSLDEVMSQLKGKENECDIYESRYCKERGTYVTVGETFIWAGYGWITQL